MIIQNIEINEDNEIVKYTMDLQNPATILNHPNFPKVLRYINPAVIEDKNWVNIRNKIEKNNCYICKSNRKLIFHKIYNFDFKNDLITYIESKYVCESCHLFSHIELLQSKYENGTISDKETKIILKNGFDILIKNKLMCNYFTWAFANDIMKLSNKVDKLKLYYNDRDELDINWYVLYNGLYYKKANDDEDDNNYFVYKNIPDKKFYKDNKKAKDIKIF